MIYEYRCRKCGNKAYRTKPADSAGRCDGCVDGELKRDFSSIAVAHVMQEHWNHTVNKPISDMGQFKRELKRAGAEAEARTGMPNDYQPVDKSEFGSVLGMTEEGLDSTNRLRVSKGLPAVKVPKG